MKNYAERFQDPPRFYQIFGFILALFMTTPVIVILRRWEINFGVVGFVTVLCALTIPQAASLFLWQRKTSPPPVSHKEWRREGPPNLEAISPNPVDCADRKNLQGGMWFGVLLFFLIAFLLLILKGEQSLELFWLLPLLCCLIARNFWLLKHLPILSKNGLQIGRKLTDWNQIHGAQVSLRRTKSLQMEPEIIELRGENGEKLARVRLMYLGESHAERIIETVRAGLGLPREEDCRGDACIAQNRS